MSSLLCANIFFESTQNTGITYAGSNTVNILSGGSTIGTINTTSISVNNIVFNTNSYVSIGNSTVNAITNSSSLIIGSSTVNSTVVAVGANVVVNTSTVSIGNSTVNTTHSPTSFSVNGNNISPFNFRNKIINGNMMIDQRNSGANTTLSTNNNVYSLDRWWGQVAANTTGCIIARATDGPTGYLNSLKVQRTASNTGTSAITVGQVIESFNCYDLQGQTITLSFWAKAGANLSNTSVGITVKSGTTADEGMAKYANNTWAGTSNVISTSQTITTTWTKYTFTSASALGSSIAELGVSFSFTPVGTAGTNDWFEITGVQLEAGSVATPFEMRPMQTELALCQRYYLKWHCGWSGVAAGISYYYSSTAGFPVQMRATPTLGVTSQTNSARYPSAYYGIAFSYPYGLTTGYYAASVGGNDAWYVDGTASAEL